MARVWACLRHSLLGEAPLGLQVLNFALRAFGLASAQPCHQSAEKALLSGLPLRLHPSFCPSPPFFLLASQ